MSNIVNIPILKNNFVLLVIGIIIILLIINLFNPSFFHCVNNEQFTQKYKEYPEELNNKQFNNGEPMPYEESTLYNAPVPLAGSDENIIPGIITVSGNSSYSSPMEKNKVNDNTDNDIYDISKHVQPKNQIPDPYGDNDKLASIQDVNVSFKNNIQNQIVSQVPLQIMNNSSENNIPKPYDITLNMMHGEINPNVNKLNDLYKQDLNVPIVIPNIQQSNNNIVQNIPQAYESSAQLHSEIIVQNTIPNVTFPSETDIKVQNIVPNVTFQSDIGAPFRSEINVQNIVANVTNSYDNSAQFNSQINVQNIPQAYETSASLHSEIKVQNIVPNVIHTDPKHNATEAQRPFATSGPTRLPTEAPRPFATSGPKINNENFTNDNDMNKKPIEIYYFNAPWCGHCRNFSTTWQNFKDHVMISDKHDLIKIKDVNCEDKDINELCKKYKVEGYPTIIFDILNEPISYDGPRTFDGLKNKLDMTLLELEKKFTK